jgi:IS30 family transposase
MKVTVTDLQIRRWKRQGYSLERIASACGLTISQTSRRIRRIWSQDSAVRPDPKPHEISAACERIQREWSDAERQRRQVCRAGSWTPAVVPASVLALVRD